MPCGGLFCVYSALRPEDPSNSRSGRTDDQLSPQRKAGGSRYLGLPDVCVLL
jgi:hypothetical protein